MAKNRRIINRNIIGTVRLALCGIGAILLLLVFCNVLVRSASRGFIHTEIDAVPEAYSALVLGSAVYPGGNLTPVLRDRADTALELYVAGKVKKILVSGDNGTKGYDEVTPVKRYLAGKGVPESDIHLDFAGFDTYDSVVRAKKIFGADSVIIVTQSFHLPRAIFLGRAVGLDVSGISADRRAYLFRNRVRESLASVKAVWDVVFRSSPRYLGPRIPISGDAGTLAD